MLLILLFKITRAQNLPPKGSNIANPKLQKFAGSWISINQKDTIWLKLKVENIKFPGSLELTGDVIVGYIKYLKGKQPIFDNMSKSNLLHSNGASSILAGLNQKGDTITGTLRDQLKNKSLALTLALSKSEKLLSFFSTYTEGLWLGGKAGRTLPPNLVFRKINIMKE